MIGRFSIPQLEKARSAARGAVDGRRRGPSERRLLFFVAALALASLPASQGHSAPGDFYQGKDIELVVSSGVGGSSDTLSRFIARDLGENLPGHPTVVVRNMPGAGGLTAASYLYNVAPKDGTSIAMIEESVYEAQRFDMPGLRADVRKFNWLGRIMSNNAVLIASRSAAVKTIADAFHTPLIVSATGLSSLMRWTVLKRLTGIKFKLIVGHEGSAQALMAMERGEVDAFSMPWTVFRTEHADLLREKKVNILLQTGLDRAPDLPNTPRLVDLGSNDEQRKILELISQPERVGRALAAPPGVPQARIEELRAAFAATLRDPDFQAKVKALRLDLDPMTGADLQKMIVDSFDYAPNLVKKAEDLAKLD